VSCQFEGLDDYTLYAPFQLIKIHLLYTSAVATMRILTVSVCRFRCPGKNDDKAVEYTYTGCVVMSAFKHLVQLLGHKPTHVHACMPGPSASGHSSAM